MSEILKKKFGRCALQLLLMVFLGTAVLCQSPFAFAAQVCNVKAYGAKGDRTTKDTHAIQSAINACAGKGGTVRLKPGTYLTGPIVLRSNITLEVATGATLLGSQDKSDYPEIQEMRETALQPLIGATNAENITIRGGGVIDGAGQPWWADVYSHKHTPNFTAAMRPRLILLDHCKHVLIEEVTVQNSPSWQIVPYYSDDVTIRNGKILAPARSPNTDGIDPFSSHHVTISHMTIDVGDDNVAIKSGQPGSPGPDDPSSDIVIRDCIFLHGHGMSIGSEIAGGVQNVRASHIQFKDTGNGIRIKSNRDRGGDIGNFSFRDIAMENVGTPILVTEYYPKIPDHDAAQPLTRLTPHFHNISITNLTAAGAKQAGIVIGLPESPITAIALSNVHISSQKGMTISDATVTAHDFEVTAAEGEPFTLLENAKIDRK
ncbi:MAG: glycoside hydrolase family 28 protein [Terracidiphilus sp.]